ncbi:hypothetical protein NUSPORA_02053 [Nucleospora cyclopteri]
MVLNDLFIDINNLHTLFINSNNLYILFINNNLIIYFSVFYSHMNQLFENERIARNTNNVDELQAIQFAIIESCKTNQEILQNLKLLQNKRKQNYKCFKALINYVVKKMADPELLEKLLNEVVAGKMYLETERMEISQMLKDHYKEDPEKAYKIVSNVPVETFTSVDELKKNEFLFEIFRLGFLLKKFVDCELILRKVRKIDLTKEEKIIFYNFSILLRIGRKNYLEASNFYNELIELDPSRKNVTFGAFFSILSNSILEKREISSERRKKLDFYVGHKETDQEMRDILIKFISASVIEFQIVNKITEIMQSYEEGFLVDTESLKLAILEHNFRLITKFFSKATINQISSIMQISENESIEFVSLMVNEKFYKAKINQQTGIVDFGEKKWNDKVDSVLDKIISVNHLIDMESLNMNE